MSFNKMFAAMFEKAMMLNYDNILKLAEPKADCRLLDLGCDDGEWTLRLAGRIGTRFVYGLDIVKKRLEMARKKGVRTRLADLSQKLPYSSSFFDVVHANQVIEHVPDLDRFLSETYRVLKKGGYAIVSTENGSSWHNIFAAVMGWQMFSLTNLSAKKPGIGNPMAIHGNEKVDLASWTHKTIFHYLGLKEFFYAHGFKNVTILGAGYYPLPAWFGRIDPRHSHFITIRAHKS